MADVTMCTNGECPLKESCYRFRAVPSHWQSFSHFDGGDNCEYYILIIPSDSVRSLDNPWDTEDFNNNTTY
jgi:hypothetical protein